MVILIQLRWWLYVIVMILALGLLFFLFEVPKADAFTVTGRKWPGTSTTYKVSNDFYNSGPGWGNRINSIAVPDWNASSVSPFRFYFNSSSGNLVEAGYLINNSALALTTTYQNGTTLTQFFLRSIRD